MLSSKPTRSRLGDKIAREISTETDYIFSLIPTKISEQISRMLISKGEQKYCRVVLTAQDKRRVMKTCQDAQSARRTSQDQITISIQDASNQMSIRLYETSSCLSLISNYSRHKHHHNLSSTQISAKVSLATSLWI